MLEKVEPGAKSEKKPRPRNPEIVELEDQLRGVLGTKVQIKNKSRGGKIEIDYYDDLDLNRIIELLIAEEKIMA
ncbi:hypothetical protein N752_25900 [Desulforamulus aquiferis]|nr:hypothetical protein N752_25900 [Desulforamulus aquiferis]